MPRYTYKCEDCEATLDVIHLMKEKLSECSECSSTNIKKILSPLAVKVIRKNKIGDAVKQGIEKNIEILKQGIEKSREEYDE